jgi:plasmid maintenance system killer protein
VEIFPTSLLVLKKVKKYGLEIKFKKQLKILEQNINHRGLNVELLEPKKLGFYSFRVDRKFRAIFIFRERNTMIEILNITVHYH